MPQVPKENGVRTMTTYTEVNEVQEFGIRWGFFDEPSLRYPSQSAAQDVLTMLASEGLTGGVIVTRTSYHGDWQEIDPNGEKIT
jgi:hypothetical protein